MFIENFKEVETKWKKLITKFWVYFKKVLEKFWKIL